MYATLDEPRFSPLAWSTISACWVLAWLSLLLYHAYRKKAGPVVASVSDDGFGTGASGMRVETRRGQGRKERDGDSDVGSVGNASVSLSLPSGSYSGATTSRRGGARV